MVRRRLTLKRVDPWSVLKFGFVLNLALLAIWMLAAGLIWFFVQRLDLIDKVCSIATDMGFVECGVNGGNLFRALFLLGLLGVVINTGLFVFLAFLHNLIADLVGGLQFGFDDDTPGAAARGEVARTAGSATGEQRRVPAVAGATSGGGGGSRSSSPPARSSGGSSSAGGGSGSGSPSNQPQGGGPQQQRAAGNQDPTGSMRSVGETDAWSRPRPQQGQGSDERMFGDRGRGGEGKGGNQG